jgi:hypothetical protein
MKAKPLHIILGAMIALITPLIIGLPIAYLQGIKPENFLWAVFHLSVAYNTAFQIGVAANIGIFFLLMKKDALIFWARGWMVGTMITALVAMLRIAQGF